MTWNFNKIFRLCNWLGKLIFELLETTGRTVVQVIFQMLLQLRRMNMRHTIYQMAHLGVDIMPIVVTFAIADRIAMMYDKMIIEVGTPDELKQSSNPPGAAVHLRDEEQLHPIRRRANE